MKQQNKIILRCFLNYRSSGKSASAQRQHRAAIKWYFEFYEGRFDLNLKPYKITKKMGTGETKKHKYWSPNQIQKMLKLSPKAKLNHKILSFAGHIMYECAMRRQDAHSLTWKHFTHDS